MTKNIKIGKIGESLASSYFTEKGYQILHKSWRCGNWEVDLIASKNSILHVIEVKTKSKSDFGFPEDEVSFAKINYMISAAEIYLNLNPKWQRIQFDVLAIVLKPELDFFLIEDVYI